MKARERRVWTTYRERYGLGGARGLRSWVRALTLGAAACGARKVLTACSRARIVEYNCKCSIRVGCAMGLGLYV